MATHFQYSCWENLSLGEKSYRSLAGYSPWGFRELDMTEHAVHA